MNLVKPRPVIGLLLILSLYSCGEADAITIRYVKAGASGTGANWSSPSGSIQAMVDASAVNDQVWVASGTYTPGTQSTSSFNLKNGVQIYGGFLGESGTEGDPNARDSNPLTNSTNLSGFLVPLPLTQFRDDGTLV